MMDLMIDREIQVGSTLTNGSRAIRITERVERGSGWQTSGWLGTVIALEQGGGGLAGLTIFVSDQKLGNWRHVPFEWALVNSFSTIEERYVWSPDYRRLVRELRVKRSEDEQDQDV